MIFITAKTKILIYSHGIKTLFSIICELLLYWFPILNFYIRYNKKIFASNYF